MVDTLKYFVKDGVYKLNNSSDEFIFICIPSAASSLGKLVQYKYEEGIYESDDIRVEIVKTLNSSMEYLEKGVLVGVKGRLMSENNELRIVAEKLTFLTSNRNKEEE